ncbi:MAG: FHA domain-containing protein [Burkholderiales bacterium]
MTTRFIIRHLTGAKANQETAFTTDDLQQPLTLGRDLASRFVFDDADDAVSRQHARIERDADGYRIIDLGSANGTFVNRVRVDGAAALAHGDIVQFGKGGPQASIHLDPPQALSAKATRVVSGTLGKPTREIDPEAAPAATGTARVGRATVERLITAEKSRSTRLTVNIVAGFVAVVGALGVWQVLDSKKRDDATTAQIRAEREAADAKIAIAKAEAAGKVAVLEARGNLSKRVKTEFGASTVFIEASWRLTETYSGKQIYQATIPVEDKGNMPAYVKMEDGSYEPMLELSDRGKSRPIGGSHTGTGFVVSDNGVIMTNRHVAAAWHAPFDLPFPGVVVERRKNDKKETELVITEVLEQAPASLQRWIPSRSQLIGSRGVSDSSKVTGTVSSMTVTFANSKLRTPATLGTISPEHDVALIKIEAATGHLKKVQMRDAGETLASGDAVAVLGYPSVSAKSYVVTASSDTQMKSQDVASVPEVSVNQGIVSKVVRGKQTAGSGKYVSVNGDMFEMSINSAGQGNSGGPVFDVDGKVVGIFAVVGRGGLATQTGAVPIRYGLELLDPTRSATAVAANNP